MNAETSANAPSDQDAGTGLGAPVVLTAGGTGGHMFPAEALARALLERDRPVHLITDRRGAAFGDRLPEVAVHRIHAGTLGAGPVGKARGLAALSLGTLQAMRRLRGLNPAVVVGFGGYPSIPAVMAARMLGIPVVLHEQNAILGRANRLLGGRAARIATGLPDLRGGSATVREKLSYSGNPTRAAFAVVRAIPYEPPGTTDDAAFRLLVFGGSQGARVFSDVVPAALHSLPAALTRRLHLTQQCRPEDLERTRQAYAGITLASVTLDRFFTDMPERLAAAHLVLCRAGASTLAELTMSGRPAILVPYPHAMDDHQTANAAVMAEQGAAWSVAAADFEPARLAELIAALVAAPGRLTEAAAAAHRLGVPDAAERLADIVLAAARPAGRRNARALALEIAA